MRVTSVNTGSKQKVRWRLRSVETGIFKHPVTGSITLGSTDVAGDDVVDRRYHGGVDKACYLYSADAYDHFKNLYPDLEWNWGMFGENVTVQGLDESDIFIGSAYQLGTAMVEVSEPRQPCFKLGIRMGSQKVLKQFINYGASGVYVRVLEPGEVKAGDQMKLISKGSDISIKDIFLLLYKKHPNSELVSEAIKLKKLAESARRDLTKTL